MFRGKTKKYNVRKVIFTLHKDNGNIEVEIIGRLCKKSFLLFLSKWEPDYIDPKKIVEKWGLVGFIKINPREFISIKEIKKITFKTRDFYLER